MSLAEIVLTIGALAFAGFGIVLLIAPAKMRVVDLLPGSANARTEVRAMYGGLEIGIAIFLGLCLQYEDSIGPGLSLLVLTVGGLAVARVIGIVIERGRVSRLIYFFAIVEFLMAFLASVALKHRA